MQGSTSLSTAHVDNSCSRSEWLLVRLLQGRYKNEGDERRESRRNLRSAADAGANEMARRRTESTEATEGADCPAMIPLDALVARVAVLRP
eukprot:994748-Rhodomonas_salina.1